MDTVLIPNAIPDALRLRFEREPDGSGELFVDVRVGAFSGASSAWFDARRLVDFAHALADAFPLSSDVPLSLEGGYWATSGSVLEQLHVGLTFHPIGITGEVGCRVTLASPVDRNRHEARSIVTVELRTRYEPLRVFARSLESLARGTIAEAILHPGTDGG